MPELSDNGLNRKISGSEEIAKELDAVEAELAALKVAYEQYFLGIERMPPTKQYAEMKKRVAKLKGAFVRQTAIKFRVQAVQSKFLSYERLWTRTLQEMEAGTYRRDLFKAKLHQQKKAPATQPPTVAPLMPEVDADAAAVPEVPAAPAQAATQARSRAPVPSGSAAQALSDARLKAIYDAYVTAKKRCQEDVSKLTFESVAANLRKQVPELMKKHNASGVDFKVVIKDGKAILRAVPK
jgi:hypothetical protein